VSDTLVPPVVFVAVVGVVVTVYPLADATPSHVMLMLVRLVNDMLVSDVIAAAGVTGPVSVFPPIPAGTMDVIVKRYVIPPVNPTNVSDVPLVVCVVVTGLDTIEYDVTPYPEVQLKGTWSPDVIRVALSKMFTRAVVYMVADVTSDEYTPIEF
jgi:hypothetical protein